MKNEVLLDAIGQIDEEILERHRKIDLRLARRYAQKRNVLRILSVAACLVLVFALCLPLAALAHPVGRAALQGDFEPLAEQLYQIEGYEHWQKQTANMLEQLLPGGLYAQLQNTPIFHALMQPRFPDLTVEDTFEQGVPYHLYFLSNGDGTCTLKYVTTDPEYAGDFVIEIPETSPEGDVVTAIHLAQTTRVKQSPHADFPYVMTVATMNELLQTAQNNNISGFDAAKMTAYYLKLSINDIGGYDPLAVLDAFPIVALGDIYVFDSNAGVTETEKVYEYLTEYGGWNEEKYQASVDGIMALAKQSSSREQAELALSVLRTADLRGTVEISIPATVRSIDPETWLALSGLENVTVAKDHPTLQMVDGCLVDTETGTLKLYLRDDGGFPEGMDIRVLDSYAFALCDLQPNVEGAQNQVDLFLPESVTQIKDHCFEVINVEYDWKVNIYLPKSLRYFGREAQDQYDAILVYHYPGTLAEWENDVVFEKAAKIDFVYLLPEDAEEPIKFFFPTK